MALLCRGKQVDTGHLKFKKETIIMILAPISHLCLRLPSPAIQSVSFQMSERDFKVNIFKTELLIFPLTFVLPFLAQVNDDCGLPVAQDKALDVDLSPPFSHTLYQSAQAATINTRDSCLKQQKIILGQFWRPEV